MGGRGHLPDSLGPLKVPPVTGMATRAPQGPFPTSMGSPTVAFMEYRKFRLGGLGDGVAATGIDSRVDIADTALSSVEAFMLASGDKGNVTIELRM